MKKYKERLIAMISALAMIITSTGVVNYLTFADDEDVSPAVEEVVVEETAPEEQDPVVVEPVTETTEPTSAEDTDVSVSDEEQEQTDISEPVSEDADISSDEQAESVSQDTPSVTEETAAPDAQPVETQEEVQTTNIDIATVNDADAFNDAIAGLSADNRVVVSTNADLNGYINNVNGVYFDGTYYLSFASEDDLYDAVFCFDNFGMQYAIEGSAKICGTGIAYANAQINPNATTKIAVIDTGSNVANEKYSVIGDDVTDENGHGTNMANLILGETNDAYIISVKAIGSSGVGNVTDVCAAVQFAINSDVDVILLALSIRNNGEYEAFEQLIADAQAQGITVIASAGNNNADASNYLPAGVSGVITVGAITEDGYKNANSNYGTSVNYYIPADSTSIASAIFAGKYIEGATDGVATSCILRGRPTEIEDDDDIDYIADGTVFVLEDYYPNTASINDRTNYRMTVRGGGSSARKLSYADLFNISSSDDYFTYGYYDVYDPDTQHWNTADEWATDNVVYCIEASKTNPFGTGNPDYTGVSSSNQLLQAALACAPGGELYDLMKEWWATNGTSVLKGGTVTDQKMYAIAHMAACYAYAGSYSGTHIPSGTFRTVFSNYIAYLNTLHSNLNITGWWCKVYTCQSTSAQQDKNALQKIARGGATLLDVRPQAAYAGFSIDKETANGMQMTGATFTVYSDEACTTVIGTITDPNNDGVYDTYTTSESFGDDVKYDLKDRLRLVKDTTDENIFDRTVYLKETAAPTAAGGITLSETLIDNNVYEVVFHYDHEDKQLTYSVNYNSSTIHNGLYDVNATIPDADPIKAVIGNSNELDASKFIDGASISVLKTTDTNYDTTSTVFSLYAGTATSGTSLAYARYDATTGLWLWYTAKTDGTIVGDGTAYPVVPGNTYTIVEDFTADAYIPGVNYTVVNSNGWTKISDTKYFKTVTASADNGGVSSVVARNDHETVSINLVKTSTQPDLIANRQFTVAYHGNGTAPNSTGVTVATLTTNAAGKASLSDLPVGWYSITEKNNDPDIKLTVTWQYGTEVTYGDAVMLHATVTSPDLTAAYTLNVKNERPTVQTEATDAASGSQQPTLTREVTITDTVSYENFIPGRTYKVIGTLMDRTAKTELLDENGDPITAEKVFTASATGSGTVEVVFPSVKIELLRGKTIVVFEDSYDTADNLIVSHHRFEDYPQTLFFPEIGTTLIDRSTQDHIASTDETAELVDVIAYDNLLPGHYVAVGTLMNKQTQNAVTDENGNPVRVAQPFDVPATVVDADGNPMGQSGTVEVTFIVDTTKIKGLTGVAFEEIHEATVTGRLIAEHKDINDVDQTIEIADIQTTLLDEATHTKTATFAESVKLIDTVTYEHLVVGKTYTLTGVLMSGVDDNGNPIPVLDASGNPVTGTQDFTPNTPDGTVDVEFTLNTKLLVGVTEKIVAFEICEEKNTGIPVAIHADITSPPQTLDLPSIGTMATGADGTSKTIEATSTVTVIDTIEYKNLTVGRTYEIHGALMSAADTVLTVNGTPVTAVAQFVPTTKDGTTQVTFTFDGRGLEGKFVVFEEVYDYDDATQILTPIAEHKDFDDDGQSIRLYMPPKTGDERIDPFVYVIGAMLSGVALAGVMIYRKGKLDS